MGADQEVDQRCPARPLSRPAPPARWRPCQRPSRRRRFEASKNPLVCTPGDEKEYQNRNAAKLEWLAEEEDSPGVMLVIQANPFEEDTAEPSGFSDLGSALEREVVAFGRWSSYAATATRSG